MRKPPRVSHLSNYVHLTGALIGEDVMDARCLPHVQRGVDGFAEVRGLTGTPLRLQQLHICLPSRSGSTRVLLRLTCPSEHWPFLRPALRPLWNQLAQQVRPPCLPSSCHLPACLPHCIRLKACLLGALQAGVLFCTMQLRI